jgi:gliding motility-associated-like protein
VTMPNIFTPDGDGLNDYFAPVTGSSIKVIQFKIFNRWGAEVFNKRNQQGWDGTIDGKAAVSDVYVYVIEYILKNGNKEFLSGDVTLIR